MKAADRRAIIIAAALHEFGEAGLSEVSTEAIAQRAGVSQPYIFRLFGTKSSLIVAAIEERTQQILDSFRQAVENRGDLSPLDAMAAAYMDMLAADPSALRCQLHMWAAANDPGLGPAARASYLAIWRQAAELGGEDNETVRDFMAHGMLLTVVAALGIQDVYADPSLLFKDA